MRVYHHYKMWEDYPAGFYNNCSGAEKTTFISKAVEMFNDPEKCAHNMRRVINEWRYSCEHNLTNEGLNKIAYIGQAACCLYAGIPSTVTMEAWSQLSDEVQKRADRQAEKVLNEWKNKNKRIQLCLNID